MADASHHRHRDHQLQTPTGKNITVLSALLFLVGREAGIESIDICIIMKTATQQMILSAAAVVTSSNRCSAFTSSLARHAIGGKKEYYSTIDTRRVSTCIYSVPYLPNMEEEGDDGSFFLSASQQAANDRYELLKQGKDPLAISLSTSSVQEVTQKEQKQNVVENEEVAVVNDVTSDSADNNDDDDAAPSLTLEKDEYNDILSSVSESPMAQSLEEKKEDTPTGSDSTSILDEIKRVEDEIEEVKSQMKDKIDARMAESAKRVGEGSTAKDDANLAAADQVATESKSDEKVEEEVVAAAVPTSTDSTSDVHAEDGSIVEEMEDARKARLVATEEIEVTESSAVTTPTSQSEEEKEEEIKADAGIENLPAPAQEEPKLSSDGKVLYEPTQEELDINQENIENGLMVLTRSFLVLNSIVQRLDEGKK